MKTKLELEHWRKINSALASSIVMAEDLIKIHNDKENQKPLREMYSSWLEEVESARRIFRENLTY